MEKILITGAAGQIGSELTAELNKIYGSENVFPTDLKKIDDPQWNVLDVNDKQGLLDFVKKHKITQIYHLAAILSGKAEQIPDKAWQINMNGLLNILNIAKDIEHVNRIFWPSSIAVFGPTTPKQKTPQRTIIEPTTVYGITKFAGERWCEYYYNRYNVDVRSIRYPGLISYKTLPGGGTTDYAVEIFYDAIEKKSYKCFLKEDTYLPMLFMSDAIEATLKLMHTDLDKLTIHSSYNIGGMSFAPKDLAQEIKNYIPDFQIIYEPDYRQAIAESWPQSIDDTIAREDWGFEVKVDLKEMVKIMLQNIAKKLNKPIEI